MTTNFEIAHGTRATGMTYTVLTPLLRELARVNLLSIKPLLLLRDGLNRQESQEYGVGLLDELGDWRELEPMLESFRAERRERAGH